jgi:hypothetical protein
VRFHIRDFAAEDHAVGEFLGVVGWSNNRAVDSQDGEAAGDILAGVVADQDDPAVPRGGLCHLGLVIPAIQVVPCRIHERVVRRRRNDQWIAGLDFLESHRLYSLKPTCYSDRNY